MKRISVFCGSRCGNNADFEEMAAEAATAIVSAGYGVVCGGGGVGLMKVVAEATLASGGQFTAVIPREFLRTETTPRGTILHVVDSLHARKALMMRLSQAFIALPGGFGTIDEFCEVLSWRHFQIHSQPIGLLNYRGYYDALLKLFDRMVRQGFVDDYSRGTIVDAPTIHELLASMFEQRRLGQCLEPVKWDESASRGDRSAPG